MVQKALDSISSTREKREIERKKERKEKWC
jgi:hypothetical protein